MSRDLDDLSFDLHSGEVLAVVGESGCGKSTLVLTLLGMEPATAGSIRFAGEEVTQLDNAGQKRMRRQVQMIFPDPYESLNPLMTIGETVAEPLLVHGLVPNRAERRQRVYKALEDAGLKPAENFIDRRPHELSGGQRQRVVIAGALVLEPTLLLADEPVSTFDVSIRAEILNLLNDLRRDPDISIIFITHDLNTVASIADRIAVMYWWIVEIGPTPQVLRNPQHPCLGVALSCSGAQSCACVGNTLSCRAKPRIRLICRQVAAFTHVVRSQLGAVKASIQYLRPLPTAAQTVWTGMSIKQPAFWLRRKGSTLEVTTLLVSANVCCVPGPTENVVNLNSRQLLSGARCTLVQQTADRSCDSPPLSFASPPILHRSVSLDLALAYRAWHHAQSCHPAVRSQHKF
ncbi:MAG: dipeptide/oligopeptide/nickel ABC transporter ATP-binding protein [Caldilineaceae bacterium]